MASKGLADLPNEILTNVCKQILGDKGTHGGKSRLEGDPQAQLSYQESKPTWAERVTLWGLCLVSRRINGPATEALYENVDFLPKGSDVYMFLRTVLSNSYHAGLVRRIWIRDHKPQPVWDMRDKRLAQRLEDFALQHELPIEVDPDTGLMKPNNDINQILAVLALPSLRTIDVCPGNVIWSLSEKKRTLGWLFLQICRRGGLPLSLQSVRFKPDKYCFGKDVTVPLLSVSSLRELHLTHLGRIVNEDHSLVDPMAFSRYIREAGIVSTSIRRLVLDYCSFSDGYLVALLKVMPKIEHLDIDVRRYTILSYNQTFLDMERSHAPETLALLVSLLKAVSTTLKSLRIYTLDHAEGRWREGYRLDNSDAAWSSYLRLRKTFEQPVDFSKFKTLESLEISALALGCGGPSAEEVMRPEFMPPKLRALVIDIPQPEFFDPSTDTVSPEVALRLDRMLVGIFKCTWHRAVQYPSLERTQIWVPNRWPSTEERQSNKKLSTVKHTVCSRANGSYGGCRFVGFF